MQIQQQRSAVDGAVSIAFVASVSTRRDTPPCRNPPPTPASLPFPPLTAVASARGAHTRDFKARGDYIQRSFVRGFSVCKKA